MTPPHPPSADSLRLEELRYRTLFEQAPDGIVIADPQSFYLDANPSMCRMLGYRHDELVGLHASDIVAPSELKHIGPALEIIRTAADYQREWQFRRKDGSTFRAEVMVTTMPDGNLLAMIRDTTERDRIQARFRRLVESNAQGVMFWNAQGDVTGANDTFLAMIGYSRGDLDAHGFGWKSITPSEFIEADRKALKELASVGVSTAYEKEFIHRDGTRVPVLVGAAVFEDNPEEGVSFVLDLTERKKLERQFLRAQRMESIGTLAGGIAHDLNNVFAPILLTLETLKEQVSDPQGLGTVTELERGARRGAALVQHVLAFARGVEGRRIKVNPFTLMRDLMAVVRDTFPKSIALEFNAAPGVWTVVGDPTQLHQVVLNLCLNARDAMPAGGKLSVRLENLPAGAPGPARDAGAMPGASVVISVEDTGTGIAPEVKDRIFEPFFTTKEVGKGTGLGLSTTQAIVASHGGSIRFESQEGKGTTFSVCLPADAATPVADERAVERSRLPRGQGELVLVVDDEEVIRNVVGRTLERYGYRVLLAVNGAEAVQLYTAERSKIAVVLTDMAMPVMDGPATILALRALNPAVRIIASSGFTPQADIAKTLGIDPAHFLAKPYTSDVLLNTLAHALGSRDSA